jgi:hypothetical protein
MKSRISLITWSITFAAAAMLTVYGFNVWRNTKLQAKVFRSDEQGFEIKYPTFGIASRVVPAKYGFDFQFWSDEKKSYWAIFTVAKHPVTLFQTASIRETPLAEAGGQGIYYLFWQNGPDAKDLNEIDLWYRNGGKPEARFIEKK